MAAIHPKNMKKKIIKFLNQRAMVNKFRWEMAVYGGRSGSDTVFSQFHIVHFIPMNLKIPKEKLETIL